MTTEEQVFLERVLTEMNYAHGHLHKYAGIREKMEHFNEIVEAWEDLTGKRFVPGEDEEEEVGEEVGEEEEEEEVS